MVSNREYNHYCSVLPLLTIIMKIEYEIKILDINKEDIMALLQKLWATYKKTLLQKRYVYDFKPVCYEKWVRLRSNWEKTTLCIKEITDEQKIEWTKELEVEVSDFDTTNSILQQLWYQPRAYQENRRTSYTLDWCDIEIDERPRIPAYIEIEWPSKEAVENILYKLNIEWKIITSENTTAVYKRYGIDDLEAIPHLSFD